MEQNQFTNKTIYKILIVDDVKSVCNSIRRELTLASRNCKFSFKIVDIQDPSIGLKHAIDGNYDLLISDIKMPHLTGDKLINEVKKVLPNLPVIVVTGFATKENIVSVYQSDPKSIVLGKPWDNDRLLAAIEKSLNISFNDEEEPEKIDDDEIFKNKF
ncbi:MAG: response regulator [Leptospiraceae bacterium]|nr:response regulator [Leptospiraceae bacterium]